jgi:predicted amidohydrolase YtcJ
MAEHGITLNSNPSIRWAVGDSVAPVIGLERNARRQPLRMAWDLGVNVCASSDAPVAPPDWRLMAAAAMTRSIRTDPERSDGQQLTAAETMLSLTAHGAWQSRSERWRGFIEPGMAADLVVLDRRMDWSDPWSLLDCSIRSTIVGGHVVYGEL